MSQEYKVGEWYRGRDDDDHERQILGVFGIMVVWWDHTDRLCISTPMGEHYALGRLRTRIKDADGNPVPPPEELEDKLCPVKVLSYGVFIEFPGGSTQRYTAVGQAIGSPSHAHKDYVCIGFTRDGGKSMWQFPMTGPRGGFYTHAIFRHHSKISQGAD